MEIKVNLLKIINATRNYIEIIVNPAENYI